MDELDKLEKDFVDRYEFALSINGDEICKEIDSLIPDDLCLIIEKAICYCIFLKNKKK